MSTARRILPIGMLLGALLLGADLYAGDPDEISKRPHPARQLPVLAVREFILGALSSIRHAGGVGSLEEARAEVPVAMDLFFPEERDDGTISGAYPKPFAKIGPWKLEFESRDADAPLARVVLSQRSYETTASGIAIKCVDLVLIPKRGESITQRNSETLAGWYVEEYALEDRGRYAIGVGDLCIDAGGDYKEVKGKRSRSLHIDIAFSGYVEHLVGGR